MKIDQIEARILTFEVPGSKRYYAVRPVTWVEGMMQESLLPLGGRHGQASVR